MPRRGGHAPALVGVLVNSVVPQLPLRNIPNTCGGILKIGDVGKPASRCCAWCILGFSDFWFFWTLFSRGESVSSCEPGTANKQKKDRKKRIKEATKVWGGGLRYTRPHAPGTLRGTRRGARPSLRARRLGRRRHRRMQRLPRRWLPAQFPRAASPARCPDAAARRSGRSTCLSLKKKKKKKKIQDRNGNFFWTKKKTRASNVPAEIGESKGNDVDFVSFYRYLFELPPQIHGWR
jgi:hypothetical protein